MTRIGAATAIVGADPQEWLTGAQTQPGSWWEDFVVWLGERCGPDKPAAAVLGGGLPPLEDAPGTYVSTAKG